MNRSSLPLAILLSLCPASAWAQVGIHIELGLPVAPPLVLIQPGIQVVEGFHEEVFFHRGWYWCRRPDGWYRARSPRARFVWVERHRVPGPLVRVPMGHYRNWHREGRPGEHRGVAPGHREERRHERREERREERRDERRREYRENRQPEGRDHHGHDPDRR
ncbi:MAG: hypothetical protein IPP58_16320 [Holophagaceae bacterium]|uniref:YXWGXW repeat-containing protein n=1 Tax=Candidatus Geothrix skivensis TaxID=2954439 RepID=A0A9D7SIB8_9BACT|nr:hypothetical protein [Candidatus Geothrix skivensis]